MSEEEEFIKSYKDKQEKLLEHQLEKYYRELHEAREFNKSLEIAIKHICENEKNKNVEGLEDQKVANEKNMRTLQKKILRTQTELDEYRKQKAKPLCDIQDTNFQER